MCCNLSVGVALNVRLATNGLCTKNNNTYTWCEQAIIEWSWRVISVDINMWMIEHNNSVRGEWSWHLNYCCLLRRCQALRTCRSDFSNRNKMVLWTGLGRTEVSLLEVVKPRRLITGPSTSEEAITCSRRTCAARCNLFTELCTAACILFFLASTPINSLCNLFACCWVIRDCRAQLSHHHAARLLIYHARNLLQTFLLISNRCAGAAGIAELQF